MQARNDTKLIERFIAWAIKNDLNQSGVALAVGRSRAWASLLLRGEIAGLNFDTRNRIIAILKKGQ